MYCTGPNARMRSHDFTLQTVGNHGKNLEPNNLRSSLWLQCGKDKLGEEAEVMRRQIKSTNVTRGKTGGLS